MGEEWKDELSEDELIELRGALRKYRDRLELLTKDRRSIEKLITYIDDRLREISWEKYQKEKGIE